MLAALGLLVVPLIRDLPLGQSTRTGLVAWLLVGLAMYWLYAGMGYRPLLLLQLMLFSTAAALLSAKLLLVVIDINRATGLRYIARGLILVGAGCAIANRSRPARSGPSILIEASSEKPPPWCQPAMSRASACSR